MLFPWRKSPGQSEVRERLRSALSEGQPVIDFQEVSLAPYLKKMSVTVKQGGWWLLLGPNPLGKALFCDLCFGFIEPQAGDIPRRLKNADVSFLGRSNATYGYTLWEHITCGARHRRKELVRQVVSSVVSPRVQKLLAENRSLVDVELTERDYLEIAEANLLLKKRPAVIVDATADFYKSALEQGFHHSELFLNSDKTIFWILDDNHPYSEEQSPWKTKAGKAKASSLYFSSEAQTAYIN